MKRLLIPIFVFLLSLSLVSGLSFYNGTGGEDNQFRLGAGEFDGLSTTTTSQEGMTNSRYLPLVADLDNNNVSEIIVFDSSTVKLFQNSTLDQIDSFPLPDDQISNVEIFDIDSDGFYEIIFALENNDDIMMLQYNGTDFFNDTQLDLTTGSSRVDGSIMIKCGKADECLMVYNQNNLFTASGADLYARAFSSSAVGTQFLLHDEAPSSSNFCLPHIRSMSYADQDNDGTDEYIFNSIYVHGSASDEAFLFRVSVSGLVITEEQQRDDSLIGIHVIDPYTGGSLGCHDGNLGRYITPVSVFDYSTGGTLEIAYGVHSGENNFKIGLFSGTSMSEDKAHPILFRADGIMVSNVIRADIWSDTGITDYCVMGYFNDEEEIDLLCGKAQGGGTDSFEFKYDYSGDGFNVSTDFGEYDTIVHAVQHSTDTTDIGENGKNNDASEILTPYGVFEISDTTFNGTSEIKSLVRIFDVGTGSAACIQANTQEIPTQDIICLGNTSLFYIDDQVENEPAKITDIFYNPCPIGNILAVNTTMQITLTIEDQNPTSLGQDLVNSNVTVYLGDSNQQLSSKSSISSGDIQVHGLFQINKTGNFQIQIKAWDNGTPEEIALQTESLVVADTGLSFGDATCDIDLEEIAESTTAPITGNATQDAILLGDEDDNFLINGVVTFSDLTGIPGTIGYLLLMIIAALVIMLTPSMFDKITPQNTAQSKIIGVLIVEVLMLIIGVRLKMISFGVLLVLIILAVSILGVWIKRHFFNPSGG